jgi:hypothetical protein
MGYRCNNHQCFQSGTVYRSAEAENMSMKYLTFGMDVLALVGQLRFKEHKTIGEIAHELEQREVITTERNVQKLYERYSILLHASAETHAKKAFQEVTEEHGGIILSIDGVQPEKGNETLYVIREVLSGTVVAAQNVKSSAASELKAFIQPVLDLGFPILGFVSDGQRSIRMAIEGLAPNAPYQYCQYHYLKSFLRCTILGRKALII